MAGGGGGVPLTNCDPGCPRGVQLGINLPVLLAMVRYERCFIENVANSYSVWSGKLSC